LFDFDKSALKPAAIVSLDSLAGKVKSLTLEVIVAVGHTDSIGTEAYNQKLSIRRAEAVKKHLVNQGIEARRIYIEGKGESQPVADNKTNEGRAMNRRVQIEAIGTRAQ
jgi:OOP family OmpA-OmpF porin